MSNLIIIRGNCGSGKTTLARCLQKELGANTLLISQDLFRREILYVNDGMNTLVLPLLSEMLKYGRYHCDYVILEGILKASWYTELFDTAISLFKSNIFAYYYYLPFEETLKRHEERDKKLEFGEEEMRRWWNEKDYLNNIQEKHFDQNVGLEDGINTILQNLNIR